MSKKEVHSDSVKIEKMDSVTMPGLDEDFGPSPDVIAAQDKALHKEYLAALAFAEEPVTIRVEPQSGDNAPNVVDCWVNGKGAELLQDGQWVSYGAFPVGCIVTTKRKYLENLAMSKKMSIRTNIPDPNAERPQNLLDRSLSRMASFSIIEDRSPKAHEWAMRILSHR